MTAEPVENMKAVTDVVIIGAGFAGCQAAIVLSRDGYKVTLIDINATIPSLFRAEKIAREQLALLQELELFEDFKAISTRVTKVINIRGRHTISHRPVEGYGVLYPAMIEMLRKRLPPDVVFKIGQVSDVRTSGDIQQVVLANGETIDARLAVLATGQGESLRRKLGFERRQTHPQHTVCVGLSLKPPASGFRFASLAAYGESKGDGIDYITFFPLENEMRVNLFMFADIRDPRVVNLRNKGLPALLEMLPNLRSWIGDCEQSSDVVTFPVELTQCDNVMRDGVVLIGDAFRTSCPAAGTGLSCVMVDVIRLRHHVAQWLKTPGMSAAKIASYYADPIKVAHDNKTHAQALQRRNAIMGNSLVNQLRLMLRPAMDCLRDWLCMIVYRADWERQLSL